MTFIVLFGSLILLIMLSVPIGFAIGLSTLIAIIFTTDNVQLMTFSQQAFTALDSFPLIAIPFFILAGMLMGRGGVAKRLLDLAKALVGFIAGGLAIVTVLACMFFAAISGSSPATVAAIGSIMIPEMKAQKYGSGFPSAITAAAGSLGSIIPPSISFILIGVAGGVSISGLFLAGIIPGILIGLLLMISSYFLVKRKKIDEKEIAVPLNDKNHRINFKNVWEAFRKAIWSLLAPIIVLGGIYAGYFTPTEASVIAVAYAIIVGVLIYKELNWKSIYDSLVETLKIVGSILHMLGLAMAFAYLLTVERIPVVIAEYLLGISDNWIIILLLINIFLLIVGCFIDTPSSIAILTPILLPIAMQLGIDPIHFGVIMVVNLTIGNITPPMGVNLFVASSVGKTRFEEVVKATIPLFIVLLIALTLITYIPQLSLLLPNLFD